MEAQVQERQLIEAEAEAEAKPPKLGRRRQEEAPVPRERDEKPKTSRFFSGKIIKEMYLSEMFMFRYKGFFYSFFFPGLTNEFVLFLVCKGGF